MADQIRIADPNDAEQILEIYRPVVLHTAISFELEPPSVSEMEQRIAATLVRLPWLIITDESRVLGYAYASAHRIDWPTNGLQMYLFMCIRKRAVGECSPPIRLATGSIALSGLLQRLCGDRSAQRKQHKAARVYGL